MEVNSWELSGKETEPCPTTVVQGVYGHIQAVLPEDQNNTAEEGCGGEKIDFFRVQKITKQINKNKNL